MDTITQTDPPVERREAHKRPGTGRFWPAGAAIILAIIALFAWRSTKTHAKANVSELIPTAAVARVTHQDLYNELEIPAEFRPYQVVELHAKVSGYLAEISVDIGDHVKAGQLLARLEVPEAKDDLDNALAAEKRAEADYN